MLERNEMGHFASAKIGQEKRVGVRKFVIQNGFTVTCNCLKYLNNVSSEVNCEILICDRFLVAVRRCTLYCIFMSTFVQIIGHIYQLWLQFIVL